MLNIKDSGEIIEVELVGRGPRNVLTWEVMRELRDCAIRLQDNARVRVIVLKGRDDVFTGGFDLESAVGAIRNAESLTELRSLNRLGGELCSAWEKISAITICAIEGYCVGGGAALAISCDLRVAGAGARFYVPEILRAMNLGWGAIPRLVNLIGPARAKEVCILADKVDAEAALSLGLIERCVAAGDAAKAAREMAEIVAKRPPVAAQIIKRSINAYASALVDVASFADGDQFILMTKSGDFSEGVDSFLEKREPAFTGK